MAFPPKMRKGAGKTVKRAGRSAVRREKARRYDLLDSRIPRGGSVRVGHDKKKGTVYVEKPAKRKRRKAKGQS